MAFPVAPAFANSRLECFGSLMIISRICAPPNLPPYSLAETYKWLLDCAAASGIKLGVATVKPPATIIVIIVRLVIFRILMLFMLLVFF